MKTNNDIKEKVERTFSTIDVINEVKVSPFFKDKTMNLLFAEKEKEKIVLTWFSPKLQLATLVCVMVLNILAFVQINTDTYDTNINEFADNFGLIIDVDETLFDIN